VQHKEEHKIEEQDEIDECDSSYVNEELTYRHKFNSAKSYLFMGDHSKEEVQPSPQRSLHINDFKVESKVCLTVTDTGLGIPTKDQQSLFKLFGKLSSNHDRNKTGCGLGLTICKMILQKMGGDISLESKEGEGTKVTCHFLVKQ
jgi:signal transduction histidine kinase